MKTQTKIAFVLVAIPTLAIGAPRVLRAQATPAQEPVAPTAATPTPLPTPAPPTSPAPAAAPITTPAAAPRVFRVPAATLAELRNRIATEHFTNPALVQLRADADHALTQPPLSVINKDMAPPSGDKHDYMTLAPYWWPDPTKPDGLPYIRRDGQTNPEIHKIPDHETFDTLVSSTYELALAYYLFRDENYATHAELLLRAWFLDPATRMNPNLQYAQAVRGVNEGRGTGLIETRGLGRVCDAVGLLAGSQAWTVDDQTGLHDWFAKFLDWMRTSGNGKDEAAAQNNHGSYYDVQVTTFALFVGDTEFAKEVLSDARTKRIGVQVQADGEQPLELVRTKSLGYSTMNLSGLFELARLGDAAGVDLWTYESPQGGSIRKALDYLVPYVDGEKKWPNAQIVDYDAHEFTPLLLVASVKYGDPHYQELAVKLDPGVVRDVDAFLVCWKPAP
jgi:hypothetical protein